MILAPKLSEFTALSILAFIHNKLFAALHLFVYCVLPLGNSVSEPLFEDLQDQVFEESEVFFSGQQGKCP
jgi:hypothetical protein